MHGVKERIVLTVFCAFSLCSCGINKPFETSEVFASSHTFELDSVRNEGDLFGLDTLFFRDYAFLRVDGRSFVLRGENGSYTEKSEVDPVRLTANDFQNARGLDLSSALRRIGLPSFKLADDDSSLVWSFFDCVDGISKIYALTIGLDGVVVSASNLSDRGLSAILGDEYLASVDDLNGVKRGMSIGEIIRKVGLPQEKMGLGEDGVRFYSADRLAWIDINLCPNKMEGLSAFSVSLDSFTSKLTSFYSSGIGENVFCWKGSSEWKCGFVPNNCPIEEQYRMIKDIQTNYAAPLYVGRSFVRKNKGPFDVYEIELDITESSFRNRMSVKTKTDNPLLYYGLGLGDEKDFDDLSSWKKEQYDLASVASDILCWTDKKGEWRYSFAKNYSSNLAWYNQISTAMSSPDYFAAQELKEICHIMLSQQERSGIQFFDAEASGRKSGDGFELKHCLDESAYSAAGLDDNYYRILLEQE